jgi:prepilin-type N-terminal cleavage/methylation domain-containing protein
VKNRAFTLVETLAGIVVIAVVLAGLMQAFVSLWKSQNEAVGMSSAQTQAQQIAISVANAFRGAIQCTANDTGCTVGATVESPTSTSCTIYSRNSSGTLVETNYGVTGGNYQLAVNGGTPITVYTGATLALTYYTSTTYYSTSMTTYTPTASTTANLVAVGIVASVTQNNITKTYSTLVRIRNHP